MISDADEQDRPWMKITGRYSGTGQYAWTEQYYSGTAFVDLPGGRVGTVNGLASATATILPAVEMNAQVLTTFPVYVRGERAIESSTVGVYYLFAASAPPAGPTIAATDTVTWLAGGPFTHNSTVGTTTGLYLVCGTFVGGATFGLGFPAQWIVTQFQPAVTGGASVNNTPFWVAMGATIPASGGAGVPVVCANTTCSGATTLFNLVEITSMGSGGTVVMATGITYNGTAGTDQLQFKYVSTKLS